MRVPWRALTSMIHKRFGNQDRIVGVEVGVSVGGQSEFLLTQIPNLFLYMVDVWDKLPAGSTDGEVSSKKGWRWFKIARDRTESMANRRNMMRMSSMKACAQFERESMDFVYIDADHWYVNVKQDLEVWWPIVRDGGLFAGHDYNGVGDRKHKWGVKRAVDEFAAILGAKVGVNKRGRIWMIEKKT